MFGCTFEQLLYMTILQARMLASVRVLVHSATSTQQLAIRTSYYSFSRQKPSLPVDKADAKFSRDGFDTKESHACNLRRVCYPTMDKYNIDIIGKSS